jgi:starch phosphorylase
MKERKMIKSFYKLPVNLSLPRRIQRLSELSFNMWWSWNQDAQQLFRMIDKLLWDKLSHNPITFLQQVDHALLDRAINDL